MHRWVDVPIGAWQPCLRALDFFATCEIHSCVPEGRHLKCRRFCVAREPMRHRSGHMFRPNSWCWFGCERGVLLARAWQPRVCSVRESGRGGNRKSRSNLPPQVRVEALDDNNRRRIGSGTCVVLRDRWHMVFKCTHVCTLCEHVVLPTRLKIAAML